MAFKIALFAAVCFAQVFAFPGDVLRGNTAEEFAHTFDEMSATVGALGAKGRDVDIDILISCVMDQKSKFVRLGKSITRVIREGWNEWDEELKEKSEKFIERTDPSLREVEKTVEDFPRDLEAFLRDYKFHDALRVIKVSGVMIRVNGKRIAKVLEELVEEIPEASRNVRSLIREIKYEFNTGSKGIRETFGRCVEQGGPNFLV